MGILQRTAKSDKALYFPKLRFGKDAEMNHSVSYGGKILYYCVIEYCNGCIVYVLGFDAVKKSHKAVDQIPFALCVYANSVGIDIYTVIEFFKLCLGRISYSENRLVTVCKRKA